MVVLLEGSPISTEELSQSENNKKITKNTTKETICQKPQNNPE
jgi:hypothetical protein